MAKRKRNTRKKKSPDELSTENELLKLKMMAELGGNFVGSDDIPPEVENQFLKQISKFHKLHETSKTTTIYKLIGEPEYNHVHDLNDKEVKRELKRLMSLMNKHGVALDVLAPTPDREIYRFVVEELFKQETEEIKLKGWISQYIYEDFHPNAEHDVRNVAHFIILSIFAKGAPFFADYFSENMKDSIGLSTDAEELKEKIEAFQSQFYNVKLIEYDVTSLVFNEDNSVATVLCDVTYKAQKEKGRRTKNSETTIEFLIERNPEMQSLWEVKQMTCPVL
jgi:hypothetical protein